MSVEMNFDTISFEIDGENYSYNTFESAKRTLDILALKLRKAVHDHNIVLAYTIEEKMCNTERNLDYMSLEYNRKMIEDAGGLEAMKAAGDELLKQWREKEYADNN